MIKQIIFGVFFILLLFEVVIGNSETMQSIDSLPATLDYVPTIVVSNVQNDSTIIAVDGQRLREEHNSLDAYILTNDVVYDMLVSIVFEIGEFDYIEAGSGLYIPVLSVGESVCLTSRFESNLWRIAYTNSAGEYEAVLMYWDKSDGLFMLSPIEPMLVNEYYDVTYFDDENYRHYSMFTDEFRNKVLTDDLSIYVPSGFVISSGSIGDINNDGIEDAIICLTSAGRRIAAYHGVMPLFALIGQLDGGYVVEHLNQGALYTPYRNSTYPIAGTGYIDMVYNYVSNYTSHFTEVYRFFYDSEKHEWLLKEFLSQPTYSTDYSERMPYSFVQALPSFYNMRLIEFVGDIYSTSQIEWNYFDMIAQGWFPDASASANKHLYTLALRVNDNEGYYEGYIHRSSELSDSGFFVQTIRGNIELDALYSITIDEENYSFIINNDKWKFNSHNGESFYLESNGNSLQDLKRDFESAIDDYLEACAEDGIEPHTFLVKYPTQSGSF